MIGNHDVAAWPNYEKIIYTKLSNFGVLDYCYGNVGINMVCSYKGLLFVMSGIGTTCNNHLTFIEENLALHSQFAWKFCAWHKPNVLMSAGYDNTTVDIAAYDVNIIFELDSNLSFFQKKKRFVENMEQLLQWLINIVIKEHIYLAILPIKS